MALFKIKTYIHKKQGIQFIIHTSIVKHLAEYFFSNLRNKRNS